MFTQGDAGCPLNSLPTMWPVNLLMAPSWGDPRTGLGCFLSSRITVLRCPSFNAFKTAVGYIFFRFHDGFGQGVNLVSATPPWSEQKLQVN